MAAHVPAADTLAQGYAVAAAMLDPILASTATGTWKPLVGAWV